jgi:uncharacterized membrane protein (DUF485 family)
MPVIIKYIRMLSKLSDDATHKIGSSLNYINNNKYLAGLCMILFNIGSRYLFIDISKSTENLLKTKIFRRITLFSIFFVATRDLVTSFILTAVFIVFTMNLFNEDSAFCILPNSFKDNIYTSEEYDISKNIITQYEKLHSDKVDTPFCSLKT